MKRILVSLFAMASLFVPGAVFSTPALASVSVAVLTCDDDVPAVWKRQGGYCSLMGGGGTGGGSITDKSGGDEIKIVPVECVAQGITLAAGERLHLAAPDPCDGDGGDECLVDVRWLTFGDRVRIAC